MEARLAPDSAAMALAVTRSGGRRSRQRTAPSSRFMRLLGRGLIRKRSAASAYLYRCLVSLQDGTERYMSVATVISSLLLASLLCYSAARKLSHEPRYIEGYLRVGVPERRLNQLAGVLVAGAASLVAGLFWTPVGIASAIALLAYFAVAIAFHLRADDC